MFRSLFVLFWLLAYGPLFAQDLVLRQLDEERGLPSNCVLDLYMDHECLLWIGTNKGLYRYDGFTFERIGVGTPLDKVNVVGMLEIPERDMFVFAGYGNRLFTYTHRTVREIPMKFPSRGTGDSGTLTNLMLDSAGLLHAAHSHGYVHFLIDLVTGTQLSTPAAHGPQISRISTVNGQPYGYNTGTIKQDSLITEVEHSSGIIRRAFAGGRNSFGGRCPQVVRTAQGDLYFCQDNHLVRIDPYGEVTQVEFSSFVLGFTLDRTGRMWVRVNGAGITCFDKELGRLPLEATTFQGTHVTDLLEDAQGGLWFSTIDQGLFYCASSDVTVYRSKTFFGTPWVISLAIGPDRRAYVGDGMGLVHRVEANGGRRTLVNKEQRAIASEVKGLVFENGRTLYPGNFRQDYDLVTDILKTHPERSRRWTGMYDLAPLSGDRYLFASITYLGIIDRQVPDSSIQRFENLRCYRLQPAGRPDQYWVATSAGLRLFDGVRLEPTKDSLLQRRTYDMLLVGDTLWLATDRGLVTYAHGVAAEVQRNGWPVNEAVRSLSTGYGPWLWVATLNGLYRIDPRHPSSVAKRYGRSQGLPSNAIYDIACDSAMIWLVAGADLCKFSPDHGAVPGPIVPFRILGLRTGMGEWLHVQGTEFEHSVEHVAVQLRSFDFARFGGPAFRYRLSGQQEWTTTDQPVIELNGLKPGPYKVEVQAANTDGGWGTSAFASWNITPAVWQRRSFAGFVFLVFGSLATAFIMYYRNRKQREALLNAQVQRYHHKALLAQMEPHFLYNALNSIQGFIARSDVEASTRYLAKFAKLMRGNLQAAHNEQITLEEEVALLDHYCALEALRTEPPFTCSIAVASGLDRSRILLPAFIVQPYVENAVRHGLRNLQGERAGVLSIRFDPEGEDRLVCTVEDNGIGRDRSRSLTAKGNAWQSHGMRINEERATLLAKRMGQGEIRLASEDLFAADKNPCGTRVSISLPLVLGNTSEANQVNDQRLPNA